MNFISHVFRSVSEYLHGLSGKNKVILKLLIIFSACWVVLSVLTYCFTEGKIMYGVTVGGIELGGKTKEQARDIIFQLCDAEYSGKKFTLMHRDKSAGEFTLSELSAEADCVATAEACYYVGREDGRPLSVISATKTLVFKKSVPVIFKYNHEELKNTLDKLNGVVLNNDELYKIDFLEKKITIFCEKFRDIIDTEASAEKIIEGVGKGEFELQLELLKDSDYIKKADFLYERTAAESKNASYAIENNTLEILPEVYGVSFDKYEVAESFKKNPELIVTAAEITVPQISREKLEGIIFRDVLAEYTTSFNPEADGRVNNIEIACGKINGRLLDRGQSFSFNDVVGKRSYEEGYVDGKIFLGGKVTEGVAGGICQASSTLYNAALLADMEILKRTAHSFAVSYVPKGQDATVSYDYIDLQFVNSRELPVKISIELTQSQLTVKIFGTDFTPDKTVKIETVVTDTEPFKVVREQSETDISEEVILQKGVDGCSVETFKITKQSGEEMRRESLGISVYKPMDEIIAVPAEKTDV